MYCRSLRSILCLALISVLPLTSIPAAKSDLPKVQGWLEVRTENFTLISNAGASRSRKIGVQLERFRQALGRITRGFELSSDVPTLTFVFKNEASYEPYKRNADGETMNVSGYFLPRSFRNYITLDASAGSQPWRIVYHEFFHAVMNNTLGDLPVWLNEGLAEYFSTFKDRDGSATVEVGHPIESHLRYLAAYGLLDWDDFFETTRESPTYNEGRRQGSFYAQAWLLTHYLNATDDRSRRLGQYLGRLRSGEDEAEAFVAAFGKDKLALGADVARYSKSGGSSYVWWDFGEEHNDVDVAVRELPAEAVYFRLGELLAQRGQAEAAGKHLAAASGEEQVLSPIHRARGIAAFYADDKQSAEASLRKAIEAGDDSAEPYAMLGNLLMDRFYDSTESRGYQEQTPELVAEARTLYETGLVLQAGHFDTLLALSRTYVFGTEDPTPGIEAIARARSMRPLDIHMLQVQVSLLTREGRMRETFAIIERDIRPKDEKAAIKATEQVTDIVMLEAMGRLAAEDRQGAAEILLAAMEHVSDARGSEQLQELHEVVVSGGTITLGESDADENAAASPREEAVDDFNEGIRLANTGRREEALEKFERIAEDCVDEELCVRARGIAGDLRNSIAEGNFVKQFNTAVSEINRRNVKGAIDILRELEATTEDPEKLQEVEEFLRRLGARVKKKKK